MFKNSTILTGVLLLSLATPVASFAASTTTPAQKAAHKECISTAMSTRDAALKATLTKYTDAAKAAIDARKASFTSARTTLTSSLKDAKAMTEKTARQAAVKSAHSTYTASMKAARDAYKASIKSARETRASENTATRASYKDARTACKTS